MLLAVNLFQFYTCYTHDHFLVVFRLLNYRNAVLERKLSVRGIVTCSGRCGAERQDHQSRHAKRTLVLDASYSGLGECFLPSVKSHDLLHDLMMCVHYRNRQGSFDIKDAFYKWPKDNLGAAYQGLKGLHSMDGLDQN